MALASPLVAMVGAVAQAQVPAGDFQTSYSAVAISCQYGDLDYQTNGSFTVTVGTETGGCADPALTTYTVNAVPIAGSGPDGSKPPLTTVTTDIGFPSGSFLFANTGAGSYTVTVTMTAGAVCLPTTNPKVFTATVPEALDSCNPEPIPALGGVGIVLLCGLLAALGAFVLRRT